MFPLDSLKSVWDVSWRWSMDYSFSQTPVSDEQQNQFYITYITWDKKDNWGSEETLSQGLWPSSRSIKSGLRWNQESCPCGILSWVLGSWLNSFLCSAHLRCLGPCRRLALGKAVSALPVDWNWGVGVSVPAASELEELCRNCRDQRDRVGQKGMPGLVWLSAGPHLEATSSVKHPSVMIIDFLPMQLVWIWVGCWCCGLWELTVQARDIWFLPQLERSPETRSPIPEIPATVTTWGGCSYFSLIDTHTHVHSRIHFKYVIGLCPASVFWFLLPILVLLWRASRAPRFCLCMLIKVTLTDQDCKSLTCFSVPTDEEFLMSILISSPS